MIQKNASCTSVMIDMPAKKYLDFVDEIYRTKQGGIQGQRAALKTKTAKIIRDRMVGDILKGVSLPPLVLGLVVEGEIYNDMLPRINERDEFLSFIENLDNSSISIIDGMQRTTAIHEALLSNNQAEISDVRVEFWISEGENNLVYRMLVLNTGQVPWDIARQLEAIYRPLLQKIENSLSGTISFLSKDMGRRSGTDPDKYETEDVVELLLIFSSRKRELNLKDQIAQDFVRLDMIESSSRIDFIDYFSQSIILLSKFNSAISRFKANKTQEGTLKRYANGDEVFKGFPAKAGFIAALAIYLFDKPGFETDWETVDLKLEKVKMNLERIIGDIEAAETPEDIESILRLEDLEERIFKHRVGASQVGRFEREYFEKAFTTLFENAERIKNLQACWLAY
jgi:hypothetical protein